ALLVISGTMLFVFARKSLKRNMVVSPKPVAGGYLIQSGIYGIIRHPGYVGIFMASFGVSLWKHDLVRIILSLCLLILFDVKTRIEESWLSKTYADYDQYKIAVKKKFIPWIY
ncbi:MAG TPA: methyltransferase, partial [Candidatus Omnitrophota bacterium]|nr:methyltransferase [Candidatus Omnitrophota bacterium]